MSQTKVLTSSHAEVRCPVNFKTQEMASACDQYSISKIVQKKSKKSQKGELIINSDLISEAIKAAAWKQIKEMKMEIEMMSPVLEKSEEEAFESAKENENKTEDNVEKEADFELEPVRFDVYSVRRRSRQFYPVTDDTEEKDAEDQRKIPVFNLGRSLKNLYCKDKDAESTETDVEDSLDGPTTYPTGYDSDSGILSKVMAYKPLRKIHSLPEMNTSGLLWDSDGNDIGKGQLGNAQSITDVSKSWKQQNLEMQSRPGYKFLASVADNLKGKQSKSVALRADMSVGKTKQNVTTESSVMGVGVNEVKNETTVQQVTVTEPAPVVNVEVPDINPKKSFLKSVCDWGSKKQTVITKREMNMYTPSSF